MNFQTKYTTGKNKNTKEALKMISVHEWIWIGFVPFCFLAIGINSLLAPIDDSYVQIAILLFAASLVLFGLSFSKILKTNLGLMKRLDEMGPPGTEIVFTINEKEIIVEKVSGEKERKATTKWILSLIISKICNGLFCSMKKFNVWFISDRCR